MNWKPIETAPRDGTWFLAFWPQYRIGPWEYRSLVMQTEWVFDADDNSWGFESGENYADEFDGDAPTHWMPLPNPPEAT
jgi:hypothetical protein